MFMRTRQRLLPLLAALGLLALAGLAQAECQQPTAPTIPDGASASREAMLDAHQAFKTFQAENQNYRNCVDRQHAEAMAAMEAKGEALTEEQHVQFNQRYNQSVEKEQALAKEFNAAVKAFKGQQAE